MKTNINEIREAVASRRKQGFTDPTPEQWRKWIMSLSDDDVRILHDFEPPQAFHDLAFICKENIKHE